MRKSSALPAHPWNVLGAARGTGSAARGGGQGSGVRAEVQETLSRSWGRHVRRGHCSVPAGLGSRPEAPCPLCHRRAGPVAQPFHLLPKCQPHGQEVEGWASRGLHSLGSSGQGPPGPPGRAGGPCGRALPASLLPSVLQGSCLLTAEQLLFLPRAGTHAHRRPSGDRRALLTPEPG